MNKQQRLDQDNVGLLAPILFYYPSDTFGVFSNFSEHPVTMLHPYTGELVEHQTTEHRYQAMKAENAEAYDYVNASKNPGQSKNRGREIHLRDGWGSNYGDLCWFVMVEALMAKYQQHAEFRKKIADTKHRQVYEDSPTDDIWGWRYMDSYTGKNLLGRAVMYVRDNT